MNWRLDSRETIHYTVHHSPIHTNTKYKHRYITRVFIWSSWVNSFTWSNEHTRTYKKVQHFVSTLSQKAFSRELAWCRASEMPWIYPDSYCRVPVVESIINILSCTVVFRWTPNYPQLTCGNAINSALKFYFSESSWEWVHSSATVWTQVTQPKSNSTH